MNYLKKIGVSMIFTISIYLLLLLLLTLFSYLNIIKGTTLTTLKLVIVIVSLFIGAFILGKKMNKKGWLEGIKFGIIILIVLNIINLIFYHHYNIGSIIYNLILLFTTTLGSMIGITKNRKTS